MPEHFNLPWRDTLDGLPGAERAFTWVAEPQGTGAMVAGLSAGDLDAALLLTEGAVTARARGGDFRIAAVYVETPLEWGIHVAADSAFVDAASIRSARYAISRPGSGSQLMAIAHARAQGWPVDSLEFVTVGTLERARDALGAGEADVFFWERVMTQPLVNAGDFRRIGVFAAPWPAFVLCIGASVSAADRARIESLFVDVLQSAQVFKADARGSAARIAAEFGIDPDEALQWLGRTRWATEVEIDQAMLRRVAEVLLDAQLIAAIPDF